MEINLKRLSSMARVPSIGQASEVQPYKNAAQTGLQRSRSSPSRLPEFLLEPLGSQPRPESPRLAQENGTALEKQLPDYSGVFSQTVTKPAQNFSDAITAEPTDKNNLSASDVPKPSEVKKFMAKVTYNRYAKQHAANNFAECLKLLPAGGKPTMPSLRDMTRLDFDGLLRTARQGTHFHGSRSASLSMFGPTAAAHVRGRLTPTGQLLDAGEVPFTGELGNALDKNALNRNHLSVVDYKNLSTAYDYACNLHTKKWSPPVPEQITCNRNPPAQGNKPTPGLSAGLDNLAQRKSALAQSQLKAWNAMSLHSDTRTLIELNFPTLYSLTLPDTSQLQSGSMPGEIGVRDGLSANDIRAIFVPSENVGFVSVYLQKNGFKIPVGIINDLQPFL